MSGKIFKEMIYSNLCEKARNIEAKISQRLRGLFFDNIFMKRELFFTWAPEIVPIVGEIMVENKPNIYIKDKSIKFC